MAEDSANPTAAAPAPAETAAAPATPVETAAAQAQVEPAPAPAVDPDADFKAALRRNARWLLAEFDWVRTGCTDEQRAQLNP